MVCRIEMEEKIIDFIALKSVFAVAGNANDKSDNDPLGQADPRRLALRRHVLRRQWNAHPITRLRC